MADELTVYVYWDSGNDLENSADTYVSCVENSANNTCGVEAQKVDVSSGTGQFWSGTATIEVVGVKNGTVVLPRLANPGLFCKEVDQLVKKLCQ